MVLSTDVSRFSFSCSFEEFSLAKKNFKWLPSWLTFFKKNNKNFVMISTRKITVLKKKWTILRSPAQDKKSREQFGCFSTKTSIVVSFITKNDLLIAPKQIEKNQYFFLACFFITFQLNKLPLHTSFVGRIFIDII